MVLLRYVVKRFNLSTGLMSKYQSSYHKFHSSENAPLRVRNNILVSLDSYHSTALLLDLSSTFDTIDHNISTSSLTTLV